jgi:cellulose synthase/poly-beta-1,6-N-acetylglucosamine synthase-like glycosyltransferase
MDVAIAIAHVYVWFLVAVMGIYALRHWGFTWNRLAMRQRPYYQDLLDEDLPGVTIVVPMHNEQTVVQAVLDALIACDYPRDRFEIIPIDDHSNDETTTIVGAYAMAFPFVKPAYVIGGERGKPAALDRILPIAEHDIILVFDADYRPGKGLIRELVMGFIDPEVGAVMGRVVPRNTNENFLTRMQAMERAGGYQVDQQARYNMNLIPQYGGTVGGFRRNVALELGGFDPHALAEDTDLTIRLALAGWRVGYANRAECYEEAPAQWAVRFRQLRRWSRGHNRVLGTYLFAMLRAGALTWQQKVDGVLLLFVYLVPPLLFAGFAANALLFFSGQIPVVPTIVFSFFVVSYSAFGNFGPAFEIAAAELLDGARERLLLLPYLFVLFLFNGWAVTAGAMDALGDIIKERRATWDRTQKIGTPRGVA